MHKSNVGKSCKVCKCTCFLTLEVYKLNKGLMDLHLLGLHLLGLVEVGNCSITLTREDG